jgi:hypothetical protein
MHGVRPAWRIMKAYNVQDVVLLVKVYKLIRPWMKNHPDLRLYDRKPGCPVCGSQNVIKRGKEHKLKHWDVQRISCRNCGKYYYGDKIKRT